MPPRYISDEVGDGLWDVAKDVFFKELLQVRTRASGVQCPAYRRLGDSVHAGKTRRFHVR